MSAAKLYLYSSPYIDATHRFVFLRNKKIFSQYWILDFCLLILDISASLPLM